MPDSSDMTPSPAFSSTDKAAASAARSERYWPSRVPASPQSLQPTESGGHGRRRVVEHLEQAFVVHGATIPEPPGSR